MKYVVRAAILLVSVLLEIFTSCSSDRSDNRTVQLCPRNEYSRNGVSVARQYLYTAKSGELDLTSKILYETSHYDSLGNQIYYKGKGSPWMLSYDETSAIRDALYSKPSSESITYKMEYNDTNLVKVVLFNEQGDYFALIERNKDKHHCEDSVYVNNQLVYVEKTIYDIQQRDSLSYKYEVNYWGSELSEKCEYSYMLLDDGTIRDTKVSYYKGYDYSSTKRLDKLTTVLDKKIDEKGRIVYLSTNGGNITQAVVFDESGLYFETLHETKLGTSKNIQLIKGEYFDNGLIKSRTIYQDKTILTEKTVYDYDFYPYSPNSND